MAEAHQTLFEKDTITDKHIERSPKDFITSLTVPTVGSEEVKEGKFSGKHHKHMLFIVDEGDTVPDFAYRGVEGCMSGGHVRLLILFNPRYEAGTPYRHERNETANVVHLSAFNHPNVITGDDLIPGAVNREVTVQRINEFCRPLALDEKQSTNTFELPDFLVGATAIKISGRGEYQPLKPGNYFINEQAFHYMVLGNYPPQPEQQLISREWINQARTRWDAYTSQNGETPPIGVKPAMGIDVGEFGPDASVNCLRYGGFVPRLISWNGLDPEETAIRSASNYRDYLCYVAYVDAIGVGAGVAPRMRKLECTAVSVKTSEKPTKESEFGKFHTLRDQLLWAVREWLRTNTGSMLPPDEDLIQELLIPTYEIKGGSIRVMPTYPTEGKTCMKELLKRSPDRLMALAMTFAESEEGLVLSQKFKSMFG